MMERMKRPSRQTRVSWLVDVILFIGATLATLTSIYFLYFPSGGYQGGRNPWYRVNILWDRHTWNDLHTWGGVLMIAAASIHLALHWGWVVSMSKRIVNELRGRCACMNWRGHFNVALDALMAVSFFFTAASGLYFLFIATEGGRSAPYFLLSRTTWDLIHTWAGVVMIIAAVIHFAIHWGWIVKVTRNMILAPHRQLHTPTFTERGALHTLSPER